MEHPACNFKKGKGVNGGRAVICFSDGKRDWIFSNLWSILELDFTLQQQQLNLLVPSMPVLANLEINPI